MPKARVESFKLNKEQMQFMKHYKETTMLHKALSAEFNKSLSDADAIRQALTEVEVSMGALVDRAKGFKFDKLEGQETGREEAMGTVTESTKSLLPEFQRSEFEESQAEFGAHKHRLQKTGSAFGAAELKRKKPLSEIR
jgi:hypothetical protein